MQHHEIVSQVLNRPNLDEKLKNILQRGRFIFIVHGSPARSKTEGVITFCIGLLVIYFPLIFTVSFFSSYLQPLQTSMDEVQKMYVEDFMSKDSIVKFYVPAFSFLFLFWLGFKIVHYGMSCLKDQKQFFIGTEEGLIVINGDQQKNFHWFEFTGNTKVKRNNTFLELELVELKEVEDIVVHEFVKMGGLESATEIEAICKQRIKDTMRKLDHDEEEFA